MPFLLAEILNFQGSTHQYGVGSFSQLDKKDRLPLQYVVNMKYTDEELEPLYQIWFSQNNVLVNHKNAWGKTPLEIAEKMPYRASLLERMKKYE